MTIIRNNTNEFPEITFRTGKVRPSKEYNNSRKTKNRTHSRLNSDLSKKLATTC
jgi:hypothetical protein